MFAFRELASDVVVRDRPKTFLTIAIAITLLYVPFAMSQARNLVNGLYRLRAESYFATHPWWAYFMATAATARFMIGNIIGLLFWSYVVGKIFSNNAFLRTV